ncbi:DUF4176 domain-containing protein [Halobacillus faecis]
MDNQITSLKIKKGEHLLPVGTVVIVEFINQAVMIYGRKQEQLSEEGNKLWDYVACPYPQGHISEESNVFFNHKQIREIIYRGLETEGELELREKLEETQK